jgi:hypothetical protein
VYPRRCALHHVIKRGNYQSDVFGSVDATKAFARRRAAETGLRARMP